MGKTARVEMSQSFGMPFAALSSGVQSNGYVGAQRRMAVHLCRTRSVRIRSWQGGRAATFYALRAQTFRQPSEASRLCLGCSGTRHPFSAVALVRRSRLVAAVRPFVHVCTSAVRCSGANKNHNNKRPGCSIHIYIHARMHCADEGA